MTSNEWAVGQRGDGEGTVGISAGRAVGAMRAPTAASERRRVASHLRRAERLARRSTVTRDPRTALVRALLLDELARYRGRGRFPQNPGLPQTPIFVDARGTRCAMAHLLEVGGEGRLVRSIAARRNLAYVRELADEPRLLAWLAAAGITVEEAAAIQPSYCSTNSSCVCGGSFSWIPYPVPATGVLDGTVTARDASTGLVTVHVDALHGDAAPHAAGDSVEAYVTDADVGAHVLVPVRPPSGAGDEMLGGVLIDEGGSYACSSQSVSRRSVRAADFIAAVTSADCAGTLAAVDGAWARDSCASGGCSIGGAAPSTLGILLAVVSVLAARGLARRPRAPAR